MDTIWKFPLEVDDSQLVVMPKGALILTVQTQRDTLCLWALVDPAAPHETRAFETFGTGRPIRGDMGVDRRYVGTYQLHNGELEWLCTNRGACTISSAPARNVPTPPHSKTPG